MTGTGTLVLVRHGESTWNASDRSTGWVDVRLTARGEQEARLAGELIRRHGHAPEVVHTSVLRRSICSAYLALDAADRAWLPVFRTWRLNERHYGALQGRFKQETAAAYGAEQLRKWRRSYDAAPPPLSDDDAWSQTGRPQYALDPPIVPRTESLRDVTQRLLPYWRGAIGPQLQSGHTVLVVAHGNSLRALVKEIDQMDSDEIEGIEMPNGIPRAYQIDQHLRPLVRGGVLLDGR